MGKNVPSSTKSFNELKVFTDAYYSGSLAKEKVFEEGYKLLDGYGIKLRQDDGQYPKMTISVPKQGNILVIGLRYTKRNGRKTEDHFLFRPNVDLYCCKGKELDKILPEYEGSHILQS